MLKWSTDYFMAAHKSGGLTFFFHIQPYSLAPDCEFVGQIGNGGVDHGFWGRPEEMTMNRFLLLLHILSFKIPANVAGLLTQHLKI